MKIGLIGCGRMGRALAVGAIKAGAVQAADLSAYDVIDAAVESLHALQPVSPAKSIRELTAASEVILLCTKPNDVAAALKEVAAASTGVDNLLVISVAAGVTIGALEGHLAGSARVIRTMPNTPALIGRGAAAFALGSTTQPDDADTARRLLEAVGTAVEVPENLLDAVTGLSGSGPAYVYLLIDALAAGGVANGLPRDQALALATQTVLGAAAMVQATGEQPSALKDMVASPGGTTIAGLKVLDEGGFRTLCVDAVTAAARRSRELGQT